MPYHIAYSTSNKAQRANTAINSLIQDGGRTGQRPAQRRTQTAVPYTGSASTSTSDVFICEITGAGEAGDYTVNIYEDIDSDTVSASGTFYTTEIAYGSTLPVGARVIGHGTTVKVTEVL